MARRALPELVAVAVGAGAGRHEGRGVEQAPASGARHLVREPGEVTPPGVARIPVEEAEREEAALSALHRRVAGSALGQRERREVPALPDRGAPELRRP